MKRNVGRVMAALCVVTLLGGCGSQISAPSGGGGGGGAVDISDTPNELPELPTGDDTYELPDLPELPATDSFTTGGKPQLLARNYTDFEVSDDGVLLFRGTEASPLLTEESAKAYPQLAQVLSAAADERLNSFKQEAAEYFSWAKEDYQENGDDRFSEMFYRDDWEVAPQRVDEHVTSFFYPFSDYTGGAHGMYGKTGISYDTATGKELALTDVLSDMSNLPELIKEALNTSYDPEYFDDLDTALSSYDPGITETTEDPASDTGMKYPYNWTLTPEGISFYFGPYAIAAYAGGEFEAVLPYDLYPNIFNSEYLPPSDTDTMVSFSYMLVGYDVTGDGETDTLSVSLHYDEKADAYTGITVAVNGNDGAVFPTNWLSPEYDMLGYFIRANGKQYVYVAVTEEDDYQEIFVFDLTGGSAVPVDVVTYAYSTLGYDDANRTYDVMLYTDPQNMRLTSRFDILCSFGASRTYHVGEDGMPSPSEEVYVVEWDAAYEPLVAKTSLSCDIVDESGAVVSAGEAIAPGESFAVYRTDDQTFLDVTLSDGRIARLSITKAEYPYEINGMVDTDCVEEVYYAG